MFYCERCGTRFNAGAASSALVCPRCRAKDGVFSPLTFQIFEHAVAPDRDGSKGSPRPKGALRPGGTHGSVGSGATDPHE
jgi:hypothetical protein